MKKQVNLRIDTKVYTLIEKRAKKNLFTVDEMIEDIIRRSMISYISGPTKSRFKPDDKLVAVFSREKRGRKGKKK